MRSVVFRYEDIGALSGALSDSPGSLPLPGGETVNDGEWILAIFEIGSRRRATAAAARGVRAAGDTHLEFERRDWERLLSFVAARSEHMRAARPVSTGPTSESSSSRGSDAEGGAPEVAPRSSSVDDIPPSSTRIPFGARVLVIDEKSNSGAELCATLTDMGLVVELVATTRRAEERLTSRTFDALVIDAHASCGDSRTFIAKLRADARIPEIPVLLLSSKPSSRDVVDAFASGCDDFLPKPFRTPELAARIFGLLRRARMRMLSGALGSPGR